MEIRELTGGSAKFRAMLDEVNLVAKVDSTLLIQGEAGTRQGIDRARDSRNRPSPGQSLCRAELRRDSRNPPGAPEPLGRL